MVSTPQSAVKPTLRRQRFVAAKKSISLSTEEVLLGGKPDAHETAPRRSLTRLGRTSKVKAMYTSLDAAGGVLVRGRRV